MLNAGESVGNLVNYVLAVIVPQCYWVGRDNERNEIHNASENENTTGEKETKVRFIHHVHGLEYLETVMPRENVI